MNTITNVKPTHLELLVGLLALLACATTVDAAPVGPLTTFTAGNPAKASEVNGNFTTIVNTVNANDARLTTVETNKQNLVTGTCPTGSAIRAVAANGTVTCQSTGGNVGFVSVSSAAGVASGTVQTSLCIIFCNAFGRYQTSPAGTGIIVVPIQLPHGATMTAFSYACYCNDAAGSSAFILRDDSFLVNVSISTVSTTIQTVTTTDFSGVAPGLTVVDNHFSYAVLMFTDGTAQSNIIPVRATVTYTIP
jgi:hypothetical protein